MERRKKWSFFIVRGNLWVWRVLFPDGTETCAEQAFRTLKECTDDAVRHGYVVIRPEQERRRQLY